MAAQVHADTIPEAIRPGFTLREALVNSSEFLGEKAVYRACRAVRPIMKTLKNRPIPVIKFAICFGSAISARNSNTYLRLKGKFVSGGDRMV